MDHRRPGPTHELLQAQEDGQLVLFCGAGVSYPAGLPGFRGLVEQVYVRLNATMKKSKYPERSPASVLQLLDLTVDIDCRWPGQELREVVNRIHDAHPELANDARLRRLDEYLRRCNL